MSKVKWSESQLSPTLWPRWLYSPWNFYTRKRVGSLSLLQGIFPTQGSNPRVLHCRQILYQLSHKGSPHLCLILQNFDSLVLFTRTDLGTAFWKTKIYDKPTANVIHNSEKLKVFTLKIRNKIRIPTLTAFIQPSFRSPSQSKQRKTK